LALFASFAPWQISALMVVNYHYIY